VGAEMGAMAGVGGGKRLAAGSWQHATRERGLCSPCKEAGRFAWRSPENETQKPGVEHQN
jgi:hypothetical protein